VCVTRARPSSTSSSPPAPTPTWTNSTSEGTEVYVGPNTLKVGVENGTITGFVSKSERRKQERENSQTETLAEAQDDWEPTSEPEDEDLANRIEAEQEEGEYAEA
jgi:hypothetical protein